MTKSLKLCTSRFQNIAIRMHHVSLFFRCQLHPYLQTARKPLISRVQKRYPVTSGRPNTGVAGRLSAFSLTVLNQADAGVLPSTFLTPLRRSVCRPIINDNNLEIG